MIILVNYYSKSYCTFCSDVCLYVIDMALKNYVQLMQVCIDVLQCVGPVWYTHVMYDHHHELSVLLSSDSLGMKQYHELK